LPGSSFCSLVELLQKLGVFTPCQVLFIKPLNRRPPLETDLKPPSRRPVLIWLIISQALGVLSLVFWLLMAGLSVMAFDSGVTPEAWTFVIVV
jgi:hypothetical protein